MEHKTRITWAGRKASLTANLLAISALHLAIGAFAGQKIENCELVFADSGAAVLRADALTGTSSVISKDQKLMQPFGIAVGHTGEFFVSDTGCSGLVGVNQNTGEQRLICSGGLLGVPYGIAVDRNGMILVANGESLLRVDPATGAETLVSSANVFHVPVAVAVSKDGEVYVLDILGAVVHVNAVTGAQTLISSGGYLHRPQGIAVQGKNVYVTDVAPSAMSFGMGRIIKIDIRHGSQTLLSEGVNLVSPVGIAVDPNGHLIVADPFTINATSADLFDGAVIQIDEVSGIQSLIARGSDTFVNPRGVAVIQKGGN